MSTLKDPKAVYIFTSLIYKPGADLNSLTGLLKDRLGDTDYESPELPFEGTSYYSQEMGEALRRRIITFEKLVPREKLKDIKVFTTGLEEEFSEDGMRTVNIDPGYVAHEHVILATGKEFAHRPYLGQGVYADLTLIYKGERYVNLEWTYPDYSTPEMRELFKNLRNRYEHKLP